MRRWLPLVLVAAGCTPTAAPAHGPTAPEKAAPTAEPATDAWRKRVPAPGPATEVRIPAPETATLENGLTLYVLRRPSRVVSLRVVVRAGADTDPAGKSGLAALSARMLSEETKKHDSAALAEAVESLGTTLSEDADRSGFELGLTVLREDVPRGLDLLSEVVRTPAFKAETFERVRSEWVDGLTAERQRVERLASLAGLRILLGPRLGAPVDGSVPDVRALRLADVARFHRTRVVPPRTAVVMVGDVSLADGKKAVESAFGDWRASAGPEPAPLSQPAAPAATRVVLVDRPGSVQSALFVAQPFPKRGQPGHEARELLSGVMGGLFTSRINKNLREEHAYTYGARSTIVSTRTLGAFVVTTSVQRDVTTPALVELLAELRGPAAERPIVSDEVERARADRVSRLGAHLEHVDRLASDLTELFEERLPRDHFSKLPAEIAALSTSDVAQEAERLTPDHLVVVVVGDAAAIRPALEKSFQVDAAPPGALD